MLALQEGVQKAHQVIFDQMVICTNINKYMCIFVDIRIIRAEQHCFLIFYNIHDIEI